MDLTTRRRPLVIALVIAAVVLVAGAVYYLADGHPKHAALAFVLAVGCGIGLWFATGPTDRTRTR